MAENRLKLAPRESNKISKQIQQKIGEELGVKVEVIIYGDGAYKDPSTGIFELADPETYFGLTDGLKDAMRAGVKYKWLVDNLHMQGKARGHIEKEIEARKKELYERDSMFMEGTTPRPMADVVSSLADLVSGSADAGTPVIVVKGLFSRRYRIGHRDQKH
jgi:F420-0:gamma-glutamyl ligase